MLTLWGARALRLDGEIGSIEPGKRADLAAFSLAGLHAAFVQRPYEALLHTTRGTDASFVLVDGRELMRDGVLAFDVAGDLELLAGVIRGMAGD
jgi:5-methylthioadenosine/S-adenosylhomocysteine deaminase